MKASRYPNSIKRIFDLILVIPALLLLSPGLALLALLVRHKLGSPLLFRQQRPGLGGQPFTILKFRTMANGHDARGRPLPDAKRLTPFGSFLRRTSLDELPELLNVLKGDMSLVGPRPLLMTYLNRYTAEQMRRQEVRPGVTGWAQVNGRNGLTWDEKLALDVWYVDHRSPGLDLKIILLTVRKVLAREGISHPGQATMSEFRGDPAGGNGHLPGGRWGRQRAAGTGQHEEPAFSPELKARAVLDVISGVKSAVETCREYGVQPHLLARWQADFLENAAEAFQNAEQRQQERARLAELERLADRRRLEAEAGGRFPPAHSRRGSGRGRGA
jgi:sugar transferase EpsL